ncbi:DUF6712 family protein [Flavobacterium sp. NKUCC04_CG]|uniref:DUF6712 family protein n=1 Tax=Flavobacterium sp. NKUCC04_CG TaxID=2842121 RepID=UPI001C5A85BA|nr:DUF6712 family protein [Flavobacterium sp. NKUCC04_CG]MBW3519498.1 hypothetical protein [Flavobacterium sp. NKUCC04_CG]
MNTLFNRNNKGSTELKSLLGFIDVDIKYQTIKPEIQSATREVVELIGREIYGMAFQAYGEPEGNKQTLIEMIQYPIAINAYRLFAPNNDLAHTNNGRRMRLEENEKQAFEWLLDRDNDALERKYYRALDDLISYLEERISEWKQTSSYNKLQDSIFRTTAGFDEIFPIHSRLLLLKLQPGIKQCLTHEIKSRIGTDHLNDFLKQKIDDEQQELYYYVKNACAFYALAWAMPRYSIQLFPEGVLQAYVSDRNTTKAKKPSENNELAYAREAFYSDFKKNIQQIEQLVKPILKEDEHAVDMKFFEGTKFMST